MNKILLEDRNKWIHTGILLMAVCIAYFKVLHAPFSTWDDNNYVLRNADIHGLGWDNVSGWFSRFYVGNYHPLTMLSFAIDYTIGKQDPRIYHFTNLALHVFNTIILYLLVIKIQKNSIVALFTSLFFALHPSQSESVSWISERKTVLCAFFYFLALLQYASYVAKPLPRKLFVIFLLGIAAMLSKAVAVALPFSLIAMHIWMNENFKIKKLWQVIIPLLLIGTVIGIVAIKAQSAGQFLNLHPKYNWWDIILLAAYAYVQYIVHLIIPVHLSVMYPYPDSIGLIQYLNLLIAAGIIALATIAWRKHWYILCAGILFYTANIVLLLQFVQFGDYLMADRYLYIAGIGIVFPMVYYPVTWLQKAGKQIIAVASCTCITIILSIATFLRNDIWMSELNFFNAILDAFPNSAVAQYSVGALYLTTGNFPEAEIHINQALILDPRNYVAWYDKGIICLRQGKVNESLDAFNKCLAINSYPDAYFSRALLYMGTDRPALALPDAEKTLETQPSNARAWYIKAYCLEQQGNTGFAIECYSKAITYENNEPLFYIRRGLSYTKINQNQSALDDLNKAIRLDPANGEAWYDRGITKFNSGQDPCNDFRTAIVKGYKVPAEVSEKLCNQNK